MYNTGVEENDGIQKTHHSSPCPCFANRGACLQRVESQLDIDSPARNGSNFPIYNIINGLLSKTLNVNTGCKYVFFKLKQKYIVLGIDQ